MTVCRLAILCLLMPTTMRAQTILGRVLDGRARIPMRNVSVTIIPDTGSTAVVLTRTTTDSVGEFLIDAPAAGSYRIGLTAAHGKTFVAPAFTIAADQTLQRELVIPSTEPFYYEFEVERPVSQVPSHRGPHYPDSLRAANIEGEVLVQFVVDTLGHADMSTFKTLRSTAIEFTDSVREWTRAARFNPATIGAHKVPQLVQMPFVFGLNR